MMEEDTCFASYKALQIPCILQQIFTYLPHADLKRSRLVSQVFNDEASRILRKRSKIVLNSPKRLIAFFLEKFENVHFFCEGFQLVNVHVATPSMQIFLDTCSPSIKSMDLRDSKWTFSELKEILMRASSQLEEVIIHGLLPKEAGQQQSPAPAPAAPRNPVPRELPGRLFLVVPRMIVPNQNNNNNANVVPNQPLIEIPVVPPLPMRRIVEDDASRSPPNQPLIGLEDETKKDQVLWLPKVKRLDLQLYDKLPEDEFLHDFIVKMLVATRNLQVLSSSESRKGKSRRERFHRILFKTLIDPKFKVLLPNLSKIDFSLTPWGEEQYTQLRLKNFPLTYLSLTVLPDISTYTVVKLVSSFKKSLVKLKISFANWQVMDFPCDLGLDRLRHLSLDWYNGSLKFVTHLNSLETLIVAQADLNEALRDEFDQLEGQDDITTMDETDVEVQKFLGVRKQQLLTSFELYQHSGAEIYPESVKKLSAMFPNLKRLVLGKLTDQSLRAVFTVFPALEEFSAIEGMYTDEGVTGIAVQPCHVCDKRHLTELCRGMYDETLINSQRRHCYIGDLKNLRKIELKSPTLTNLSVFHGILQCKRLRSITLRSFHLTYGSLRRIVDTFNLDYLETTHTFSHHAEIKYSLKKMSGKRFILNGMEAPREYSRCGARDIENFLINFSAFINPRPVVQLPKDDSRTIRHPLGLILETLTHRRRKR